LQQPASIAQYRLTFFGELVRENDLIEEPIQFENGSALFRKVMV
jgi:hypothetical protein